MSVKKPKVLVPKKKANKIDVTDQGVITQLIARVQDLTEIVYTQNEANKVLRQVCNNALALCEVNSKAIKVNSNALLDLVNVVNQQEYY